MSLRKAELKNRVIAKQKKIESRIYELKADTQGKTADEIERLKGMLKEAEDALRNGWGGLTDKASKHLKDWIDR